MKLLIGTVLGFLTGLGIGGGSLLMLWLTVGLGMDRDGARGINLLFFLPAAVMGCLFRWKQGQLQPGRLWPGILAGVLTAAVFSLVAHHFEPEVLKRGFGILLLATGVRELFYQTNREGGT